MSKYQFTESDIYLPGTDIPKNRLGIETADLLHEIEATLLQQAYTRVITDDYCLALAEGPSGQNTYIEASILCVQRADSSKLQQIILQGLQTAA